MLIFMVAFGLFALTSLRGGRLRRERGRTTLLRYGAIWLGVALLANLVALVSSVAPLIPLAIAGVLCVGLALRFLYWLYQGTV